ncbi:MAG: Rieske (2Fe-2S) protein [Candidatus Thermoplasmatota archaeon]|nr:Rieske (2Fe-2S) protein [Candidatus Thermoplasmatota archaeon]
METVSTDSWKRVMKSSKLKTGQKKMKTIGRTPIMLLRTEYTIHATGALCKHMGWPLSCGGKVDEDCITCPLHQSRYELETGEVREWSPFPLLPAYGRLVGSMRKKRPLQVHEVREKEGWIEVRLTS